MLSNITIGSDPEFIIARKFKEGIEGIPAFAVIPALKDDPIDFGGGFKVLTDNVLAEGNVPISRTKEEFVKNMKQLKQIITDHFLAEMNLFLLEADSFDYSEEALSDPRALEFGCSPYLDAWGVEEIKLPYIESNKRPCGGHIHVGYDLDSSCKFSKKAVNIALTRAFDIFAIKPANEIHFDEFRQEFYGGFGKMRHTSYGVEFRSLGGYFMKDEYLPWVYDVVMTTIEYCKNEDNIEKLLEMTKDNLETVDLEVKTIIEV